MTDSELINAVVDELRRIAVTGADVPSLLRRVQQLLGREDCKIMSVQCFHKAFDTGIAAISPIAGWCGFGGELTDAQVNSLVIPILENYRKE
jgi:hypothetical protein